VKCEKDETMAILNGRGITKSFPGVVALDKVDLKIDSGAIHCVVGENGAGKSTLVKVLTGIIEADEGMLFVDGEKIDLRKKHGLAIVGYVPQELSLFTNMTVSENLFIPFDKGKKVKSHVYNKKIWEDRAEKYIKELQIHCKPNDTVQNISVADRQLVQIARAISNPNLQVLILDEPTASLTKLEIDRLFNVINSLKEQNKAIIFITHKLNEVFEMGDRVTILRNGRKVGESKVKDVTVEWIVKQMTGREVSLHELFRPRKPPGKTVLEVTGLSGINFEDISFDLHEGEIVGFAGLVGSGRTEIMQTIFGYLPINKGKIKANGKEFIIKNPSHSMKNGIMYLPEERKTHGILPHLSVKENITITLLNRISTAGVIRNKRDLHFTNRVIDEYNVSLPSSKVKILKLSGGNQQKVLIGRVLMTEPQIMLLDEPTRGVDVKTKFEIYKTMQAIAEEKRLAIVLVSSELEELVKCSNRIIVVYQGKKFGELDSSQITMERVLSLVIGIKQGE
jgi:inositol transport system ATP-binding protein